MRIIKLKTTDYKQAICFHWNSLIKVFLLLLALYILHRSTDAYSQGVAINTTNDLADPSAMLELSSTSFPFMGLLIPRMTTVQRDLISAPAQALIIYNTTTKCFEFYENGIWQTLVCAGCQTPDIPIATAGSGATATQITANWNIATGATSYSIDVSSVADFSSFVSGYNDLNVGIVTTFDITGLTCNTTYYYRVRAVNSCGTTTNSNTITYTTAACPVCGTSTTVTDIDGNVYNTVSIGTQCWMKENLKTTKYKNNTSIINAVANATWAANTTGAYCCYNNDCPSYNATYGKLYNWFAVNNAAGICPTGWHVPTHDDWTTLEQSVCTSGTCATDFPYDVTSTGWRGTDEGYKLKESGTSHWIVNSGSTNSSGFTAIPAGYRTLSGPFAAPTPPDTYTDWWWTATVSTTYAWFRAIDTSAKVNRNWTGKAIGMSIRCVKD